MANRSKFSAISRYTPQIQQIQYFCNHWVAKLPNIDSNLCKYKCRHLPLTCLRRALIYWNVFNSKAQLQRSKIHAKHACFHGNKLFEIESFFQFQIFMIFHRCYWDIETFINCFSYAISAEHSLFENKFKSKNKLFFQRFQIVVHSVRLLHVRLSIVVVRRLLAARIAIVVVGRVRVASTEVEQIVEEDRRGRRCCNQQQHNKSEQYDELRHFLKACE